MPGHLAGAAPLGRHDVVRDLAVQRVALAQQLGQARARIGGAQQRPVVVAGGALELALDRRFQIDDRAPVMQVPPILFAGDRTATGGQHDMPALRQGIDDLLLAQPETGLALDVEDPGNVGAGAGLDFVVGVDELPAQQISQLATDGGLAGTHRPDQENVLNCRLRHLPSLPRTRLRRLRR